MKWRFSAVFVLTAALWVLQSPRFSYSGQIYEWTDEHGNLGFTDNPANIPEKYRESAVLESEAPSFKTEIESSPNGNTAPAHNSPDTDDAGHDRSYWEGRINQVRDLRDNLSQSKGEIEREIAAMNNRLIYSQPEQRERREALLGELAQIESKIKDADHQLNDVIPEAARKLNVPPGWLR